jgi:hypothetical protein
VNTTTASSGVWSFQVDRYSSVHSFQTCLVSKLKLNRLALQEWVIVKLNFTERIFNLTWNGYTSYMSEN